MDITKSREDFEAYLKTRYLDGRGHFDTWSERFVYTHSHVQAMWEGWQASRTVKIESSKAFSKFYERYPIKTFSSDGERAAALGYFMAGVELVNNNGEFSIYQDDGVE